MSNTTTRDKTVSKATSYLRSLARSRNDGIVTADDVQKFLTRNSFRGNTNQRLSVIRSVLRTPNFVSVGTTKSNRDAARSRTISAWISQASA